MMFGQSMPMMKSMPEIAGIDLSPILWSHGWIYLAPVENVENAEDNDTNIRFPLILQAGTIVTIVTVSIKPRGKGHIVEIDRRLSLRQQDNLHKILHHMLSLDFPLHEFQAICKLKKATTLLRLAKQGWGRMFRSPTLWEDAVKTLCTTNASWGYTQKMCRNLCDQLGATASSGLKTFPTPEKVIRYGERRLKEKVGMGYRNKSLVMLARRAVSGEVPWLLDFNKIPDASTAEKEIHSWHGFGTYATRHLLVLMGFHEYLPIDREVGTHLGIRKPGDIDSNLDSDHFEDWGKFRFTAYKLTRVAKQEN
jgi:3-methyladenine DNA glycosylase/8-oxoguanine DNA glycosylase